MKDNTTMNGDDSEMLDDDAFDGEGEDETSLKFVSKSSGINWSKLLLRHDSGAPDIEETMAWLREEANKHIGSNEVDNEVINAAVKTVFDNSTNKTLDLNTLTHKALNIIDMEGASVSKLGERVKNFLRNETKIFETTNGEDGRYVIRRGPGKGCSLVTPQLVKEYRDMKAKKAKVAAAAMAATGK